MRIRNAVFAVVVTVTACGPATPQDEARAFVLALAACIDGNRDAMTESFASRNALTTEQMDEMCDDVDQETLSEEARPLVEQAGRAALAEVLPTIMGAAMASALAGEEGIDQAVAAGAVDALVDAFTDAAASIQP